MALYDPNYLMMSQQLPNVFYRTRVRSLFTLVTNSLTNSLTHSLTHSVTLSKLYWCDPGVWRCQLKTYWGCCCCWCWLWGACWQHFVAELKAGHIAKLLFKLWAQGLVKILKLKFSWDTDVWLRFWSWSLVELLKLKFCRMSNLRFGWNW